VSTGELVVPASFQSLSMLLSLVLAATTGGRLYPLGKADILLSILFQCGYIKSIGFHREYQKLTFSKKETHFFGSSGSDAPMGYTKNDSAIYFVYKHIQAFAEKGNPNILDSRCRVSGGAKQYQTALA
jgi:hypothetical protein